MEIVFKRQSVLASTKARSIEVRTGNPAMYLPFVGAAYFVSEFPAPRFGDDTRAYMQHIRAEADQLHEDIVADASQKYIDRCIENYEATKKEYIDAKEALKCGGIDSPTEDQINEFDTEIKKLMASHLGSEYTDEPESVIALIKPSQKASIVKKIIAKPGSGVKDHVVHTTPEFRQAFSWWMQDWTKYENEHQTDLPGYRPTKTELETWYVQLLGKDGWYDKASSMGVKTHRPKPPAPKDEPPIVPMWVWFAAGGVVLLVVAGPLISTIITARAVAR